MSADPTVVPNATILCVGCPNAEEGTPSRIRFRHDATEVRCPRCRRHFVVQTRDVAGGTNQAPTRDGHVRYRVLTAELGGRVRPHRFTGSPGMKFLVGERITFVRRRARLVAVANQTSSTFYPLPRDRGARARSLTQALALGLAALASLAVAIAILDDALSGTAAPSPAFWVFPISAIAFGLWTWHWHRKAQKAPGASRQPYRRVR